MYVKNYLNSKKYVEIFCYYSNSLAISLVTFYSYLFIITFSQRLFKYSDGCLKLTEIGELNIIKKRCQNFNLN